MISASSAEHHYDVPDATRQVLSGIFHRIGARPYANVAAECTDPLECRYVPGIDALECLRDLKSIIDRSDQPFHILCLLGQWRCFELHLMPLLLALNMDKQGQACLLVLRLLNMAINPISSGAEVLATERLHFQRTLKKQLGAFKFIGGLMNMLVQLLLQSDANNEEMIKAIVFCVRSTILIQDASSSSSSSSSQQRLAVYGRSEEVLEAMVRSRMFEFFLCICNQLNQYGFLFSLITEIFSGIFSVSPKDLIDDDGDGGGGDNRYGLSIQQYHENQDEFGTKRPTRHGRFAGSVVVQLSTGKDLLLKASTQFTSGIDYDVGKKKAFRKKQTDYTHSKWRLRLPSHYKQLYVGCSHEFLNSAFNSSLLLRLILVLVDNSISYLSRNMDDRQAKSIAHHTTRLIIYSLDFRSTMNLPKPLVSSVTAQNVLILHQCFARWLLDKVLLFSQPTDCP